MVPNSSIQRTLASLRKFIRSPQVVEHCEFCAAELPADHQHLIEPTTRHLLCVCPPCSLLFPNQDGVRYRCVPRQVRPLPAFQLTDSEWDSLLIPINIAFFFHSTPVGKVIALYPSPAGATESLLDLDSWNDIVRRNPLIATMEPDVEALLVNRLGSVRGYGEPMYYLAPIDRCYKLVGLIRAHWYGLSGGTEVWQRIATFFDELQQVAQGASHVATPVGEARAANRETSDARP